MEDTLKTGKKKVTDDTFSIVNKKLEVNVSEGVQRFSVGLLYNLGRQSEEQSSNVR